MPPEKPPKRMEPGTRTPDVQEFGAHPALNHYRPRVLGHGSHHRVYEMEGHHRSVVKVDLFELREILKTNKREGRQADELSDAQRALYERTLAQTRWREQAAVHYFGKDHCLSKKFFFRKIPLTPALLNKISSTYRPAGEKPEAWTIVTVEKREPALDQHRYQSLIFEWMETVTRQNADAYREMTNALLYGEVITKNFTKRYLTLQGSSYVDALLREARKSPAFAAALCDFTKNAIRFANETGELVDAIGDKNIIFTTDAQNPNYQLVDALTWEPKTLELTKKTVKKIQRGHRLTDPEQHGLVNDLNVIRGLNGLAILLKQEGFSKDSIGFIDLLPPGERVEPLLLRNATSDFWSDSQSP